MKSAFIYPMNFARSETDRGAYYLQNNVPPLGESFGDPLFDILFDVSWDRYREAGQIMRRHQR